MYCKTPTNATDEVYSQSYLLWAYMEPDKVTVQGFVCFWCAGVQRRWFPFFKQNDVQDWLAESEDNSNQFMEKRAVDIDGHKKNPHGKLQTIGEKKLMKRSIEAGTKLRQTFKLGREILWTDRDSFIAFFNETPESQGVPLSNYPRPDGKVITGWLTDEPQSLKGTKDDDLPVGCVAIALDMVKDVGTRDKHKLDDQNDQLNVAANKL